MFFLAKIKTWLGIAGAVIVAVAYAVWRGFIMGKDRTNAQTQARNSTIMHKQLRDAADRPTDDELLKRLRDGGF